jgi:hypothetical protein
MKFEGTIVKEPIVKDKIIISAIRLPNRENPIQMVVFPAYRDAETVDNIKAFKIDDKVIIYGNEETNPKSKERQIIINKAYPKDGASNAKQSPKASYGPDEVNPETDFIIGGLSTGGKTIVASEPREGRKQYYTDGDWYWYEGNKHKTPTSF